jgi:hypothetical protein
MYNALMHMRTISLSIVFFILGSISVGIAYAWSGPTAAPPNGNVAAPINVGSTDQVKNGGLGVNSLAVFGNSLFGGSAGSNAYLNFGATSGSAGYGIRDNAGTLEFKNNGGTWDSLQTIVYNLTGGAAPRSWVNVSSSRFIGVTYTNSPGHDIEVSATTWGTNRCVSGFYINGGPIYVGYNYTNNSTGNAACNSDVTIPNGATYRLSTDGAAGVQLLSWYELR